MNKIIKIIKKYYIKYKELINYIVFGVLTTIVNYVVYIVCSRNINLDVTVSTFIAWLLSVMFAYITNKKYVFKSKESRKIKILSEMLKFYVSRIISGVMDVAIMFLFVNLIGVNDLIMKLISNIIIIILNYILSKVFVFKNNKSNGANTL